MYYGTLLILLLTGCGYKTTALPEGLMERNLPGAGRSDLRRSFWRNFRRDHRWNRTR